MDTPAQLCQPELLSEDTPSHDPQLQAALSSVGVGPQAMAMTPAQREAMQQQMQMLQEYMMPMLNNLSMGMTMPTPGVDVISNAPPTAKTGMSGLSCNVCAMIMPDLPTLEQHLRIHEEEKPYKCLQCGQRYKYQSAYQRHIDMNHTARLPQEKPYRCEVCGQFFKYLKSFHKHRANHTAIDRILNTADDSATGAVAEFSRTNVSMPPPPSLAPPPQMPGGVAAAASAAACLTPETMEAAFARAQQTATAPRQLISDNKGLALKEMEEESNSVTITAIKTERPDTPPAGGSQEPDTAPAGEQEAPDLAGALQGDEFQSVEGAQGGEKSWICPYCLKGFRGKENLKLHIRTHTGEKPYECGSCDKKFVGKSDLNRHLRIHTGEKPYECNVCFRRFARGDYLTKHMVTHSQGGSPLAADPECAESPTDGSSAAETSAAESNDQASGITS